MYMPLQCITEKTKQYHIIIVLVINMLISFWGLKNRMELTTKENWVEKLVDILTIVIILVVSDHSPFFPMECFL